MAKKQKKLSKKELKEHDQILTSLEKGWNLLEQHAMKVVGVIVGGIVVTAVWAAWGHFSYKGEAQASREFNKALRAYNAPVIPEGLDEEDDKKKDEESFGSEKKRAKASLALFKKVVKNHGGKQVAQVALFYIGNCNFQLGEYDEAIKSYKKFLSGGGGGCSGGSGELSPALKLVALENLAYSYEAKEEYDKALDYFARLEKAEAGIKKEWAIYHQARMWEQKGDSVKAIQLYKRVKTADAQAAMSPLKSIAEKRAVYLQTGLGAPADPAPKEPARENPEDVQEKSEDTDEKQGETQEKPEVAAEEPEAATEKAEPGTDKPEKAQEKREKTQEKPEVSKEKPQAATEKTEPAKGDSSETKSEEVTDSQ